jgi:hypothetical protein
MPADSADCIVTSPPYWAKRDYGVAGQYGAAGARFPGRRRGGLLAGSGQGPKPG